jgi:hypothetical protein
VIVIVIVRVSGVGVGRCRNHDVRAAGVRSVVPTSGRTGASDRAAKRREHFTAKEFSAPGYARLAAVVGVRKGGYSRCGNSGAVPEGVEIGEAPQNS